MRIRIICLILSCTFLLSSCYNYRDVNQTFFVTTLGIDIDENNQIVVYSEAYVASRAGGEKEGRETNILFTGKGRTLFEAMREMNRSARHKLNYMLNKAVIFSKKAAEQGLNDYLDLLFRDQEFLVRQFLFIYEGDMPTLLKIDMKEDKFIGIFLTNLMMNEAATHTAIEMRIGEFLTKKHLGSKINIVTVLYREQTIEHEEVGIKGLAVVKDDKMVGEMNVKEAPFYNYFKNLKETGHINVPHPENPDKLVTLEILDCKVKSSIDYEGDIIHITKKIDTRTTFAMSEGPINLADKALREIIIAEAEKYMEEGCKNLFNKFKEMDIDVYNLKADIERKYPKLAAGGYLDKVKLDVNVDILLEGSSDMTNYY